MQKDEDLALFIELQRREQADAVPSSMAPCNSSGEDIFSSFEGDQHDYDWLITPPAIQAISALHRDSADVALSEDMETRPSGSAAAPEVISKLEVSDAPSRSDPSVPIARGRGLGSHQVLRRPSSSILRNPMSSSSNAVSRSSSSTPRSNVTICLTTPVPRSSAGPLGPTKVSTPNRIIRSLTPTDRAATLSNHPISSTKPSTPAERSFTPCCVTTSSGTCSKPPSVSQATPLPPKSASSSRSSSSPARACWSAAHPSVLSYPSQEPAGNRGPLMVGRPVSNSRGSARGSARASAKATPPRPVGTSTPNRCPSSSPLMIKGHTSTGAIPSLRNGRPHDDAAVLVPNGIGSKMGDKALTSRKAVFPSQGRQTKIPSCQPKKPVKSMPITDVKSPALLHESCGFGRNLSRRSADMALQHMDISGNTASDFQSFIANVSASSPCSVRSINGKGIRTSTSTSTSSIFSASMATSSNASSEPIATDPQSSDFGDESSSDFGSRASSMTGSQASPICQADHSLVLSNERRVSCWVGTQGYMDNSDPDFLEVFERGSKTLCVPESLLVSEGGGFIRCDNFTLDPILGDEGVLDEASQKLDAVQKEEKGSSCKAVPE